MNTAVLVAAPLIILAVVLVLGFVGCNLPTRGTGPPLPPYENVIKDEPGLLAWWRLDEEGGDTAFDARAEHFGTYTSSPFSNPPAVGEYQLWQDSIVADTSMKSVYVDGGWVDIYWGVDLNPSPTFTIEAWVAPAWDASETGVQRVVLASFAVDPQTNNKTGFRLLKTTGDVWAAQIGVDAPDPPQAADVTPINPSLGYHLVATYNGTVLTLYVDGSAVGAVAMPYVANGSAPLLIGVGKGAQGVVEDPFKGRIQQVALYNVELSPDQVQAHTVAGQWS
jgi:Concanavalin A-like lectin/glucanases superfamily